MDELNFDETDYSICEDETDPADTIINQTSTDMIYKTIDSDFYSTPMTRERCAKVQFQIQINHKKHRARLAMMKDIYAKRNKK